MLSNMENRDKYTREIRQALFVFMEKRGLNMNEWTGRAGFKEGTLRQFLFPPEGRDRSIGSDKLVKLAAAEGLSVIQMLEEGGFHARLKTGYIREGKILPIDGHFLIPHPPHSIVVKKNEEYPGKNKA